MDRNALVTPRTSSSTTARTSAIKRDSLAAELERDPQLSTAKRQQRKHVLTSSMAQASLERQILALQTAKLELEAKLREKDTTIHGLERDRRWLSDREQEEREAREKERAEFEAHKSRLDSELSSARNTVNSLQEELADIETDYGAFTHESQKAALQHQAQISAFERRVSQLEQELRQTQNLAEERLSTIYDLRNRCEELESQQDSVIRQNADQENMQVVRDELHRQADYLRSLENTNAKLTREVGHLRDKMVNIEVLREEKRGLERKAIELEEMRDRVIKLEAVVEMTRQEREKWLARHESGDTFPNIPITISQNLKKLRIDHAELLEKHGLSSALLHQREAELSQLQQHCTFLEAKLEELTTDIQNERDKNDKFQQKAALLEREMGFHRALVASFQAELAARDTKDTHVQHDLQLKQLESLLIEYKEFRSSTFREAELSSSQVQNVSPVGPRVSELLKELEAQRAQLRDLQHELHTAESASQSHLDKIEELEQSLFELGGEVAAGRHVPPNVRILKFNEEPDQAWVNLRKEALDKLRGENEALLRRLKDLEQSGIRGSAGETNDLVPRESWEAAIKEKSDLEDLVKQKEKRLVRLQEVFKSKSLEFREAITSILGVKLAFYPNGDVRVTSVYDLNASFVFKPGSASRMQLVATAEDLPENLPETMEHWIVNKQCIPGFIASVTLECIDKSDRE